MTPDASDGAQILAGTTYFGCGVDREGITACWGPGDGGITHRSAVAGLPGGPVEIDLGTRLDGSGLICARLSDGSIFCWGEPGCGEHFGEDDREPQDCPPPSWTVDGAARVALPAAATSVAVGWAHACAALVDGTVWCWGSNSRGQLGDGTRTDSAVPVRVELPTE